MIAKKQDSIITVTHLVNQIGSQIIHENISFSINKGEIIAIIGASGCGKTTLMRCMLMLHKPVSGSIRIFGIDITHCSTKQALQVHHRWGVMFQNMALFSSLTVWENVIFPIRQFSLLKGEIQKELAMMKIRSVGLHPQDAIKYPSQLSGGMAKRAALARAIVLDPELVFLDEPSSGLDPVSARAFDKLIVSLRNTLGITFVIITHDVDTLYLTTYRVMFLGEGKILDFSPIQELVKNPHPLIQNYFQGTDVSSDETLIGKEDGY